MFDFSNFDSFDFNEGAPYVSITRNGLTFNKSVTMKLDYPRHVVLLINRDEKQIAIQCCNEAAKNAVQFYRGDKSVLSVRWNAKDLLNTIKSIMNWDLSAESYRVDGELLAADQAMLFDLKNAQKLT